MWPFKTRPQPTPTDLIVRLEAAERAIKHLQTDWVEMYEKFQRLYAKLAQRAKRDADRAEQSVDGAGVPGPDAQPGNDLRTSNPLALALLKGMGH